jgi:hypothetical protein
MAWRYKTFSAGNLLPLNGKYQGNIALKHRMTALPWGVVSVVGGHFVRVHLVWESLVRYKKNKYILFRWQLVQVLLISSICDNLLRISRTRSHFLKLTHLAFSPHLACCLSPLTQLCCCWSGSIGNLSWLNLTFGQGQSSQSVRSHLQGGFHQPESPSPRT